MAVGQGTDDEISIGTLNSLAPGQIKKFSGPFKIAGEEGQIRKCGKMLFQFIELRFCFDAGKQFMTNRSDELNPYFRN